ncbi:HicA-like toxin [Gordonia phage LittleMunchkin]|nr:HicA-like toxin [Gordonia phage LittleMunchkin]
MASNKEIKDLIKQVQAAGAEVRTTKRNPHYKVYLGGRLIGTIPSTPSDWRGIKNSRAQLRRNGLDI